MEDLLLEPYRAQCEGHRCEQRQSAAHFGWITGMPFHAGTLLIADLSVQHLQRNSSSFASIPRASTRFLCPRCQVQQETCGYESTPSSAVHPRCELIIQVDHRTVSSDGFMTNLQVVLLKLFEPVMDAAFSKVRSSRLDRAQQRLIARLTRSILVIFKPRLGSTSRMRPRSRPPKKRLTPTMLPMRPIVCVNQSPIRLT